MLENRARLSLELPGAVSEKQAQALRTAIGESTRLYRMFDDPYGRDEHEFERLRTRVCYYYFKGFGCIP
jgi:hypothetical protein